MSSGAIRAQIERRTEQAFGKAIWPHLFRDCAVTELVDCAPEDIGIAPDLVRDLDVRFLHKISNQTRCHPRRLLTLAV